MKRSMMGIYVKGSIEALEFYKKAFDAKVGDIYTNSDGTYMHAEFDVYGQIFSVSELSNRKIGNNMQFCLHFSEDEKDTVHKIYEVLKEDAINIDHPCGSCFYSPLMASLIDKYGIYWCIFVT